MATKTLRVTLADILGPAGPAGRVHGEVWAAYVDANGAPRTVRYTDGTVVVPSAPRQALNAAGYVDFVVVPSDDTTVHADDRGFGVKVGWDLTMRGDHGAKVPVKSAGVVVSVVTADPAIVQFGLKAPYVPIIPGTTYQTQGAADARYATLTTAAGKVDKGSLAINVADYGTLGTADDAATINAALAAASGRRLVFPAGAVLTTSALTANNLSNSIIDGNGATLNLKPTGVRYTGLRLNGTCENVEIRGLRVVGSGATVDEHQGIGASGADLTNIRVIGCTVENTVVGITFAADSGTGSINGLLYEGNHIENIVGVNIGFGYGLHASVSAATSASIRIIGNTIRSAQRHSIYVARGRGFTVTGNTITNHRDAQTGSGLVVPAIQILRSSDVTVSSNVVVDSIGGAIMVGGPTVDGTYAENIVVTGNSFRNAATTDLAFIGQSDPVTDGTPTGVVFANNLLTQTTSNRCMAVYNGKQVRIAGNIFRVTDATTAVSCLFLSGTANGNVGSTYMQDLVVEDNLFDLAHAGSQCIRIGPGHDALTLREFFRRNRKAGATAGAMFIVSTAITNANLSVQDQVRDGLTMNAATFTTTPQLGGPTATTAPAAGGAGALPATPLGYLTVNVNGTDRKVAYYA